MSKLSELRALKYGRSVDAPIQYHHRTGDTEGSGGTMLDIYAQEESAEDYFLNAEDDIAKTQFLKGFSVYLRKVFSKQEREFLQRVMSGDEKLQDVGRAMGVDWFKYMQTIQQKAYANTEPLLKLAQLTGWSGAEEFTETIMQRLNRLDEGAELEEVLPKTENRAKVREGLKAEGASNQTEKRLEAAARTKKYRFANPEKIAQYRKAYNAKNAAQIKEKKREYNEAHREAIQLYNLARRYRDRKRRAEDPEYNAHCLELSRARKAREKQKRTEDPEYREKWLNQAREQTARSRQRAKVRASVDLDYAEERRKKDRDRGKAWRDANKEKAAAQQARYRERQRARAKADPEYAAEERRKANERRKALQTRKKEIYKEYGAKARAKARQRASVDPEYAKKRREYDALRRARDKERALVDPEFAAKQKEYRQRHRAKKKAEREAAKLAAQAEQTPQLNEGAQV